MSPPSPRRAGLLPALVPRAALLVGLLLVVPLLVAREAAAQYLATRVATGLELPVSATAPADDPRLFIVEVEGRIRILAQGALLEPPFLDLSDRVLPGGERGLLGLAFAPDYAASGLFYVNYTRLPDGATVVARYATDPLDPDRGLAESEEVLFVVEQPAANHNAGHIAFGPDDGLLYIAMGDGGPDPDESQDWSTPLGAMLRIDVSVAPGYAIPLSNPGFRPFADPRIWAVGLRNPYRFSFDRETGDLWIADVGANRREEVNFQPADSLGGENYGWGVTEGSLCRTPPVDCDTTGLTPPVMEYAHEAPRGYAITGGYRHRGPEPSLRGLYFFADFSSPVYAARETASGWEFEPITVLADVGEVDNVAGFGEGSDGALYMLDFFDGEAFRLEARLPKCADTLDNDGDGLVDFPADPGCGSMTGDDEAPECDDGIDNDQDDLVDWNGIADDGVDPDPECQGRAFGTEAAAPVCGTGFEAALLLPALTTLRAGFRRRRVSSRRSS